MKSLRAWLNQEIVKAEPVLYTPAEEAWWADARKPFRVQIIKTALAQSLGTVIVATLANMYTTPGWIDKPGRLWMMPGVFLAFAAMFALFGLKGKLPEIKRKLVNARRMHAELLAESDEPWRGLD